MSIVIFLFSLSLMQPFLISVTLILLIFGLMKKSLLIQKINLVITIFLLVYIYQNETYYILINLIAFLSYAYDKYQAIHHKYRISVKVLLLFGLIGPFGSNAGMLLCHHKTQVKIFKICLPLFLFIHTIVIII